MPTLKVLAIVSISEINAVVAQTIDVAITPPICNSI
jgi:hypothetical protein